MTIMSFSWTLDRTIQIKDWVTDIMQQSTQRNSVQMLAYHPTPGDHRPIFSLSVPEAAFSAWTIVANKEN
jgi:hypothetical protein